MVEIEGRREASANANSQRSAVDEHDSQFECFHGTDPFDEKGDGS
jgi:hypothetical protein